MSEFFSAKFSASCSGCMNHKLFRSAKAVLKFSKSSLKNFSSGITAYRRTSPSRLPLTYFFTIR